MRLSERFDLKEKCGGFINIRERIKIMKFAKKHCTQQHTKLESLSEILSTN